MCHQEATLLERITRSIQLSKMYILKCQLQRPAPVSRPPLGIPRSSVASSAGSHQELLLCTAAATVTMCVPTAFEKQERALNALNVEKRILAADSQLPSLCYLLSWRLAQGPVLSRSLVALRWSVPVQEHAMQPLASSDRCGVPRPSFPPRACTRDLIALFRVTGDLSIIVLKVSSTWNRD